MFEALNKLVEKQEEFKKKMKDDGKVAVKAALKDIFDNFPQIEAIRWTQYTPHFNDGDACVFSVNECYVKFKDHVADPELDDEEDEMDSFIDAYSLEEAIKDKDLKKIIPKVINEFEECIQGMDDAMEDAFGDGVQVTATRKSVEVEDYEHD